jgi:hypothetical protein
MDTGWPQLLKINILLTLSLNTFVSLFYAYRPPLTALEKLRVDPNRLLSYRAAQCYAAFGANIIKNINFLGRAIEFCRQI